MKNKKGNIYVLIGVVVIFILTIGCIFLILNIKKTDFSEKEFETQENQSRQQAEEFGNLEQEEISLKCQEDADCEDGLGCTIDSCVGGVCLSREVALCYNNDDCCPENCNSGNDNNCLGID